MTILFHALTLLLLGIPLCDSQLLTRNILANQPRITRSETSTLFRRQQSPTDKPSIRHKRFKDTDVCRTVNKDQVQITGYVTLPPGTLRGYEQNYPINTFFWFVEARENPKDAPLTIWMNGGPGSTSLIGFFGEVGPCQIVEEGDRLTTEPREFGWDGVSNMLFIDQPVQTGFSYDEQTPGVLEVLAYEGKFRAGTEEEGTLSDLSTKTRLKKVGPPGRYPEVVKRYAESVKEKRDDVGQRFIEGVFASGDTNQVTNTTASASEALWQMLQVWTKEFPEYLNKDKGLHIWTESYGGIYGPALAKTIVNKNELIRNGTLGQEDAQELPLKSVGIINGWIDEFVQTPDYAKYLLENPYYPPLIPTPEDNFFSTSKCASYLKACKENRLTFDPNDNGTSLRTNTACADAGYECARTHRDDLYQSINVPAGASKSYYDITANSTTSFPVGPLTTYLNQAHIQSFIGAEVNITLSSQAVFSAFDSTGDGSRGTSIPQIRSLLSSGIKISLLYGDKDYICNYLGGESVALAISPPDFPSAGYHPLPHPPSPLPAEIREAHNFSFVRIPGAGHLVPAYAPSLSHLLFSRAISGLSLSTGSPTPVITKGPKNMSTEKLADTELAKDAFEDWSGRCFVRDIMSCGEMQRGGYGRGEGVVRNGVWYASEEERVGRGTWGYAPYGVVEVGGVREKEREGGESAAGRVRVGWLIWGLGMVVGLVM